MPAVIFVVLLVFAIVMSIREKAEREKNIQNYIEDINNLAMSIIATSSNNSIAGYHIITQLEVVTYDEEDEDKTEDEDYAQYILKVTAEQLGDNAAQYILKVKAAKLGANAIINIRIRRSRGGYINIQGDAVIIQPQRQYSKKR